MSLDIDEVKMKILLLFILSVWAANAQQLTPVQSKLDQVIYLYPNQIKRENELPKCEVGEVCSTVHKRYWLPSWIYRFCTCHASDCSETVSMLDNRSSIKVCKSDREKLNDCSEREMGLEVSTMEGKRQILKNTCRCSWPNYWALAVHVENSTLIHDRYACKSLSRCKSGEFCGHIRSDTFSMYTQCSCPHNHICLNRDRMERNISEALYNGPAMRAYCDPYQPNELDP